MWFFLVGALAPIPFYFLARRYPLSLWRYINVPVFFAGVGAMPPASGINYSSWVMTGFLFQWFMRRYHFRWWMRYNYILSAALDAGVALGLLVIFFTVQYPKNGSIGLNTIQTWWGNTVSLFSLPTTRDLDLISFIKTGMAEYCRRIRNTFQSSRPRRNVRADVVVIDPSLSCLLHML